MVEAYQQCIDPACGKTYDVLQTSTRCRCGNLLDVRYKDWTSTLPADPKKVFSERRNNIGNFIDESGVWRFRELFPFYIVNGKASYTSLVSFHGEEGRAKPINSPKAAEYVGLSDLWLQHEGINPTGSFKDTGMSQNVEKFFN
jgi:threonine synthase